jgi:DNA-binding SARP family transcriptional activator
MMLRLALLGAPEISLHGQSLTEQITGRGLALLVYLAVTSEVQTRATLAELLWAKIPGEEARSRLRDTLPRIRPWLGDYVQITRQRVAFIPSSPHWLDVALLRRYVKDDGALVDPQTLNQTLALYRNDFLGDFYVRDAPAFEEWVMYQREELHQTALQGFQRLAGYYQQQGDYFAGLNVTKRLLALEPWCEEGHRQQMRLLALSGNRSSALAQYETCQRILATEFKLSPAHETIQLYEQIRAGHFPATVLDKAVEIAPVQPQASPVEQHVTSSTPHTPPSTAIGAPLSNWDEMPPVLACYGRRHAIANVTKWLTADHCRLVGVFGMAGQGKSLLVRHLLSAVAPQATDEPNARRPLGDQPQKGFGCVLWRSFTDAPTVPQLLQDLLAKLLGQSFNNLPDRWEEGVGLLIAQLRRQRCLLVFDQLETIMQNGAPTDEEMQTLTDLPKGVAGRFRQGYELYAELLQRLGSGDHQSCVVLISRERPVAFSRWEEQTAAIRRLDLNGLSVDGGKELLQAYGLAPAQEGATALIHRYSGNPLALTIAAETIHEFFGGNILRFLATAPALFDEFHELLRQQLARLSTLEWTLLQRLAAAEAPVTLTQLCTDQTLPDTKRAYLEACRSLSRRALLEQEGEVLQLPALVLTHLSETLAIAESARNDVAPKPTPSRSPERKPQRKVTPKPRIAVLSSAPPTYALNERSVVVAPPR